MTSELIQTSDTTTTNLNRLRVIGASVCLVTVFLCLTYAQFRANLTGWWKGNAGGAPYVFFWATFIFTLVPRVNWLFLICTVATTGTCLLEFLQLWQPDWLMQVRSTRFGAALLGSGFTWQDFPPYFLGGMMGYGFLKLAIWKFSGGDVQVEH